MTRRTLVGSLAVAATLNAQARAPRKVHSEWKPKLGVLGRYTANNVAFASSAGFTNMILDAGQRSTLSADSITDAQIQDVKNTLQKYQMQVSALQLTVNHIDPDPDKRASTNTYFAKAIEMAGKLGIPYIGSASGKDASKSFEGQVDDVVRIYTEKYFPACERNHVRILWEPWPRWSEHRH